MVEPPDVWRGDEVAAPEVPPVRGTEDQALEPPDGFEHFYLREYRGVVELAYALSGNRAGAEDIAQEAFLRAHRDWQRVGRYQYPGAWVRRVAANLATSAMRRRLIEARALARFWAEGRRRWSSCRPARPTSGGRCGRCPGGRPRWSPSTTWRTSRWGRFPGCSGAPRHRQGTAAHRPRDAGPASGPDGERAVNLDAHARRAATALHDSADAVDPVGRLRDLGALERRRAGTQVALAFVLLLGLVVAGLLVGRRDLPVVGPLPSRATIQVGRQPTTVVIGQGAAWVANKLDNSVSRIDPQTNRVVATIPVPDGVADLAVGADAVWTGGDRQGVEVARVVRIDPRTNRVVATLRVAQPQDVTLGFGSVWVPSGRSGLVVRIDPQTNTATSSIRVAGKPSTIAVGAGAVWVKPSDLGSVQRIDPQTNTVTATVPVASGLYGLAVDDHGLWTIDFLGDTVTRLQLPK
jgi:YVTN family beta-propeller protein